MKADKTLSRHFKLTLLNQYSLLQDINAKNNTCTFYQKFEKAYQEAAEQCISKKTFKPTPEKVNYVKKVKKAQPKA